MTLQTLGRAICTLLAWAAVLAAIPASAGIISTFDLGTDGFTSGGGTSLTHQATGGNPGGFAFISDAGIPDMTIHASAAFLGDLRAFSGQTFSFDLNPLDLQPNPGSQCCLSGLGVVFLIGPGLFAQHDFVTDLGPELPVPGWRHYSAAFTAAAWGKTEAEWQTLLASITDIVFSMEGVTGDEFWGLDNVQIGEIGAVPEPGGLTLIALGLGILATGALRRYCQRITPARTSTPRYSPTSATDTLA